MASSKNFTEVLIGGKVFTLSGYESEEYLQRVYHQAGAIIDEVEKDIGINQKGAYGESYVNEQLKLYENKYHILQNIVIRSEDSQGKTSEVDTYIITEKGQMPGKENVWGNCCGTPRLCRMFAEKKNLNIDEVDGIVVFEAINQGDDQAIECLNIYTREIAVQIFNLQTILDVERFAIGGGISAQPIFIEYIRKNLKEMYAVCPYDVPRAEVVTCKFQNDANLIGALQCWLDRYDKGE